MSWNAQRFARNTQGYGRDPLRLWLTSDALGRLHADGGYVPDSSSAVDIIREALEDYPVVLVGLAESPDWSDALDSGADAFTNERILSCGDEDYCDDLADDLDALWNGQPDPTAQLVMARLRVAHLGGQTFDTNMTHLCHWTGASDDEDSLRGSVLETVAAALVMFTDPQARADAACTYESRGVPLKGKKARGSRRTSDVHVIDVKRSAPRSERSEVGSIEYDFRWVVRGHWRNQACGKGRTERRRMWIQEHIAGPDDKPIRRDPRVYRIA